MAGAGAGRKKLAGTKKVPVCGSLSAAAAAGAGTANAVEGIVLLWLAGDCAIAKAKGFAAGGTHPPCGFGGS